MERRRYPRQPISLSALVHPQQGRSWLCTIKDFCQEGMLLAGSGGSRSLAAIGADVKAGDQVALHFSVATPQGQKHFRTQTKIARILDSGNGMGVHFEQGMPGDAFEALIEFAIASGMMSRDEGEQGDAASQSPVAATPQRGNASAQRGKKGEPVERARGKTQDGPPTIGGGARRLHSDIPDEMLGDKRVSEMDARKIRGQMRNIAEQSVDRICKEFFKVVGDELLVKARDADNNTEQTMYFEGLEAIDNAREQIHDKFGKEVLRQIEKVSGLDEVMEKRRRRQGSGLQKLEVVDTEQFEEWLAMAQVVSKAEGRFRDNLLDLRAQLGLVAKPWTHKDVLPIGPSALAWSFDDAIKGLELRRQVKDNVYRCFENALIPSLSGLYGSVSQTLADCESVPSIEELRENLRRSSVRRTSSGVQVDPHAYQEMDAAVREAAMAADGIGQVMPRVDQNPFLGPAGGHPGLYHTARNMLGIGRQSGEMRGQERAELLAAPGTPNESMFRSEEILEALGVIESELDGEKLGDQRLKPRLMEILRNRFGDRKAFSEEDYDALDVIERLVRSLEQDQFLTSGIREWIQRLELTLNKLAAREPEFLQSDSEDPHSAVQMLNQLARLGNVDDAREGIDREVGKRVDELLRRVVDEYDTNPDVFEEVVKELNALVDRQTRVYRGNVERTIRTSEGQQKLARARRAVLAEMEKRFAGQEVPDLLLELLNPGWRNLLVHTHLRLGVNSNEWFDQLALVDQLWRQLTGDIAADSDEYVDPDALLKRVVDGLNSISFDPSKRTPLVMNLSAALVGDTTGAKAEVTSTLIEAEGVAKALGLDGLLPDADPEVETDDETVRHTWSRSLERARRVRVGEWLATGDAKGRPLILTVAFVADDSSSFVLVNRKGVKVRELTLQELADGLHAGDITLLDDFDLPLMERASQHMLEDMHSQLAFQASHDDLTQLLNRREFERQVEAALHSAKEHEIQHGLLYMDLDQFKIVNNTSGHTAGDELLKLIARTLTDVVSGRNAQVARLGGDEFGVLVKAVQTQEARDFAEELLNAVRGQRFEWEGRRYTLSASMGLVFLDQTTESVDTAMQYADEACYTAKDAGRNRLQEYELGNTAMMRRHGVMEWVAQLDKALDDDRLILNCQRIAPIAPVGNGLDTHYEILLTMMDESGEVMPPGEFIQAAETYDRMTAIDRWVISRVLGWMAEHKDDLDHFGGFAVNVSGHSVNDETFPDFVLEQFARAQAPTSKVCFEITETAAIANLENAVDFMNRMKIIGCKFALDDFGTGLSSYSYLRNLPVDYVKIDGVFVKDIADNPGDYAVVRSINEIGHYMGKKTIAEFVESQDILSRLKEIGVDFAQGYCIDKPSPLEQFKVWAAADTAKGAANA